jgi:NADPH:quinone reductase-like Zn-dependent oxidoreductase
MEAMALSQYGGPEVLQAMDLAEPKVGPDVVLIRTRAVGVNPVDYKIREGALDAVFPAHFPLVPGFDVAGVVERVGPAVVGVAPGDEVVAYNRQDHLQWGTYAELTSAPQRAVGPRPTSVDWAQAGALPLVGLTAYQAIVDRIGLREGETLLVHAASGGVGTMAVQIARLLGAEVVGTAGEHNQDRVKALGATPVPYGDGLVERVRDLRPNGVDAVLDLVGGRALDDSPALVRDPGRICSIVDPQKVLELGGRYHFCRPDSGQLVTLAEWVDDGRLRIDVGRTLPLAEAAEAQRLMEQGGVTGKIVLTV